MGEADQSKIDLRTAQSTVHGFVAQAVELWQDRGEISSLTRDRERRLQLAAQVEQRVQELLGGANDHVLGITDSGKRAIEVLVTSFCTAGAHETVAVATENYVGHNKWSAANALQRCHGVTLETPFELELGESLTHRQNGSDSALDQAFALIDTGTPTLYVCWNGTSTGVEEEVHRLVEHRDQVGSQTLILVDASSLPLLSTRWASVPRGSLPDAFFFSFRKQPALPYIGPQDEIEQMKSSGAVVLFNQRALDRAAEVNAEPVYGFDPRRIAEEKLPEGELYTLHLLKLWSLLDLALEGEGAGLRHIEAMHEAARSEILAAFSEQGPLGRLGLSLMACPEAQSRTSYVVRVPERLEAAELLRRLESEHDIVISPALHPLANTKNHNVIRFGVYSASRLEEVRALLAALEVQGSAQA